MMKTFPTVSEANSWMEQNPEWKAVTMMPGVSSGSVVMLFECKPKMLTESQLSDPAMYHPTPNGAMTIREVQQPTVLAPKRRGRPPKVKDASSK